MVSLSYALFIVFMISDVSFGLETGDPCTIENTNREGICKLFGDCNTALDLHEKTGKYPQICGYDSFIPIVCCDAEIKSTNAGEKSKQFCSRYTKSLWQFKKIHFGLPPINISTCGWPPTKPLVIGGEKALPKEFPHQALLGYRENDSKIWENGGSLISEQYIITAAHCVDTQNHGLVQRVRLGDLNIHNTTDNAQPIEIDIIDRKVHPSYDPPRPYNDIALLKLKSRVQFNQYIAPICLHITHDIEKKRYIATGWGATKFRGSGSSDLMKVVLDYYNNSECTVAYAERINISSRLSAGIVDDYMMCAGGKDTNRDTCQGDSGGPLQIYNTEFNCTYSLIGVTSFGKTCGVQNQPGIYTRISYYIDWIEKYVWP